MRRIILLILLLISTCLFAFDCSGKHKQFTNVGNILKNCPPLQDVEIITPKPFLAEKITYDVSLGGLPLGTSVFQSLPRTNLEGKEVDLMTFQTSLANFNDSEIIYSDSITCLPIRVERFIAAWPSSEKIIEEYDQKNFTVTIKKQKGKNQPEISAH